MKIENTDGVLHLNRGEPVKPMHRYAIWGLSALLLSLSPAVFLLTANLESLVAWLFISGIPFWYINTGTHTRFDRLREEVLVTTYRPSGSTSRMVPFSQIASLGIAERKSSDGAVFEVELALIDGTHVTIADNETSFLDTLSALDQVREITGLAKHERRV